MKTARDLTGQRFGRLIVTRRAANDRSGNLHWLVRCDCGRTKTVAGSSLATGDTRSCGCLQRERASACHTKHGYARRPRHHLYGVWKHMIERCENPNRHHYSRYGGRGIRVCDTWRRHFPTFLADVGERPSADHQLDRINNDGNYEPGNVRWATPKEQAANRRRRHDARP